MHCDQKIAVPTEFSGRHVRCPGCGQSSIVPFPSPEELEAAEEIGFHVRANPSAALASRACRSCGATLPPRGPCIQCGADPAADIRVAFDASLATVLTTALPEVALGPAAPSRGRRAMIVAACGAAVLALLWVAYRVFG